jgi:nitrate/nitrite transport system permease protein
MSSTDTLEPIRLAPPETQPRPAAWLATRARAIGAHVVPPLVIIALLLLIWEGLCARPGAALPPPSKVVQDTWELIVHPFYDNGGNDVGIAWQLLASLKRVAYGYSLAVLAGVGLGVLVGQSTWALRGLDPIFQVLRTVPPLAWLPISLDRKSVV